MEHTREIQIKHKVYQVTEMYPLDFWDSTVKISDWLEDSNHIYDHFPSTRKQARFNVFLSNLAAAVKCGLQIDDIVNIGVTSEFNDPGHGGSLRIVFLFKQSSKGTTFAVRAMGTK